MKTIILAIVAATVIVTFVIACALLFLLTKLFYELGQSAKEHKEFKREFNKKSAELENDFVEQKEEVKRRLKFYERQD